MRQFFFK